VSDDALVLDIGDGVGALVLQTTEDAAGLEIEVSPAGGGRRTHTIVRRRRLGGRDVFAGVYPELSAGEWIVHGADGRPLGTVVIGSGRVTEFDGGACR
jgi:hypothetical protein